MIQSGFAAKVIRPRPRSGLSESSPALRRWVSRPEYIIKSVKRTTEKLIGVRFIGSRPFHGLIKILGLAPTDESVGYCHPSASPTLAAKPFTVVK